MSWSRKMSENDFSNDNINPTVDNLVVATTDTGDISNRSLEDDIFVCRKCNKIFKNLSEYLEHKVRDENYRIAHARSKVIKRLVIPQLVEKKKRTAHRTNAPSGDSQSEVGPKSNAEEIRKEQSETPHNVTTNTEENENSSAKDQGENLLTNTKRGKKRKLDVQNEGQPEVSEKENACHLCDRKFRRAATLRWHLKYDHKSKDEDSDISDGSEYGINSEDVSNNDEDFKVKVQEENRHDPDKNKKSKLSLPTEINAQTEHSVTAKGKKPSSKHEAVDDGDSTDRPFVCEICGRGFKELPVYKAHGTVHSQERKYVCTVDGCPYGFKTKGCLVRHMRRHTGERPFECEKCGRSFTESGALSRHLKSRRNCALTPDTHYPRYKKRWSYHPNIEAVVDAQQRENHTIVIESSDKHYLLPDSSLVKIEIDKDVSDETNVEITDSSKDQGLLNPAKSRSPEITGDEAVSMFLKTINSSPSASSLTAKNDTPVIEPEDEMAELRRNCDRTNLKETQCHVCKKDFQSNEYLEIHLHSHLAYHPTKCGFCHFLATNREEMHQHVLSLHAESLSDTESFVFAMQGEETKKELEHDKKATLREALIAVKQLYGLKASKESVGSVVLHPSTTGSLQCLVCSRTFKGMNYMRQHMRIHTGDRPFKCDHCDSSFTSRDVLKKHMYVHMDQRDFKCGECGKLFKRLAHVHQHLRIHSQERSFRCTVCDKLFKTHNSLKVHLRTHTNINPYKCQVCSRHFRERGSLQRHMRLHTGERPFSCPHCNRRFAEQGTLSRHLRAKVPCSITRDTNIQPAPSNTTMLAQFSSVVADTQEYILPTVQEEEMSGNFVVLKGTENDPEEIVESVEIFTEEPLPENKEQTLQYVSTMVTDEAIDQVPDENTETLQIYDTNTGESLFITGDKSVMELVKSQQVALESTEGEFGLDRIREMLLAADKQEPVENLNDEGQSILVEEELMPSNVKSEEVITEDKGEDSQQPEDQKSQVADVVSLSDIAEI